MKSTNDPILDVQALCRERPRTEAELRAELTEFGWHTAMHDMALNAAKGTYITLGDDGLYHPRNGTVEEIVAKTPIERGALHSAVQRLRGAGLHARPTTGRVAHEVLIFGGSHIEEGGMINIVHNAFQITVANDPPGYLVRSPGAGQTIDEVRFTTLDEAVDHVLVHWSPEMDRR